MAALKGMGVPAVVAQPIVIMEVVAVPVMVTEKLVGKICFKANPSHRNYLLPLDRPAAVSCVYSERLAASCLG